MNALCVVVDGLHTGLVGCYGNAWIETPALDRLAAQGFIFDQALIHSPRLDLAYRGYWQGLHAAAPSNATAAALPELLLAAGIDAALVTDDPALVALPSSQGFGEIVQLPPAAARSAASSEETHLAACFSAAAERLESARAPFCLWLHLQGMQAAWDAPLALRERYAEDEELPPATFVEPPRLVLPAGYDPDELLRIRWAYAAQMTVLDRCLEALLEWFDAQPAAQETLLMVTGARGYPMGEHRRVGLADVEASETTLHEEFVHVPCIVRMPGGVGAADRSPALIQPADVAWTLAEWFGVGGDRLGPQGASWLPVVKGHEEAIRDRAGIVDELRRETALRTAAWHMIALPAEGNAGESLSRRLYVKPDDRWELNEVADRCGDVPDWLSAALDELRQQISRGGRLQLSPLPEALVAGLE